MSSRMSADDQLRFLLMCVKWSNNGRVDFTEVARECSVVSKGAAAKRYERMLKSHGVNPHGGAWEGPTSYRKRTICPTYQKQPQKRKLDEDLESFDYDDEEEEVKYDQKRRRTNRKQHNKEATPIPPNVPTVWPNGSCPSGMHNSYPYMRGSMTRYMRPHAGQAQPWLCMPPYSPTHNTHFRSNTTLPPIRHMPMPMLPMPTPPPRAAAKLFSYSPGDTQHQNDTFENLLHMDFCSSTEAQENIKLEVDQVLSPETSIKAEDTTIASDLNLPDMHNLYFLQGPKSPSVPGNVAIESKCVNVDSFMHADDVARSGTTVVFENEPVKEEGQDDCICVD